MFIDKRKLREIRDNCDWREVVNEFDLEVDHKKSNGSNIFVKCPWT